MVVKEISLPVQTAGKRGEEVRTVGGGGGGVSGGLLLMDGYYLLQDEYMYDDLQ